MKEKEKQSLFSGPFPTRVGSCVSMTARSKRWLSRSRKRSSISSSETTPSPGAAPSLPPPTSLHFHPQRLLYFLPLLCTGTSGNPRPVFLCHIKVQRSGNAASVSPCGGGARARRRLLSWRRCFTMTPISLPSPPSAAASPSTAAAAPAPGRLPPLVPASAQVDGAPPAL